MALNCRSPYCVGWNQVNSVSNITVHVLAPCVERLSAAMGLTTYKIFDLDFHDEGFQLLLVWRNYI